MIVDRRGSIWTGYGRQLLCLKRGAERFTLAETMPEDGYELTEAPDGSLWAAFAHPAAVRELVQPNGELALHAKTFAYRTNGISFGSDGSLWLSTDDDGLYRIPEPLKRLRSISCGRRQDVS